MNSNISQNMNPWSYSYNFTKIQDNPDKVTCTITLTIKQDIAIHSLILSFVIPKEKVVTITKMKENKHGL